MKRIKPEALRVVCPLFVDELVWHEPLHSLETVAKVVDGNEVIDMICEQGVIVVVTTFDLRFLDRLTHSLDLSVGRRMHRLHQPVFDVEIGAWPHRRNGNGR